MTVGIEQLDAGLFCLAAIFWGFAIKVALDDRNRQRSNPTPPLVPRKVLLPRKWDAPSTPYWRN
jgi:hypothetical protein